VAELIAAGIRVHPTPHRHPHSGDFMATAADLDIKMEANSLYREEIYTDRRIGTIRALIPVDTNGGDDTARPIVFMGEAQIMTQMGPLPISFEINAESLADAVAGYAEAAKAAVERTVKELHDMRRQAASSIVLPGQGGGNFGPAGFGPAGAGGGKIQIP
jgi:hypothetical protein